MTPNPDPVAVLRERLAEERQHAGKGYPEVERRIAAYEAAIAALSAQGEAVAWRAVPADGGRSPQTTWIAMPVSQWAVADVKAGVCTIEYAYLAPPGSDAVTEAPEYEVCRHLGMENEYTDWGPCPPHLVECFKNSGGAYLVRRKK